MPRARGEGRTPHRQVRLDDEPWDRFGELTAEQGNDRSAVIRDFVLWYIGERGAKLPERPKIIGHRSSTTPVEKRRKTMRSDER